MNSAQICDIFIATFIFNITCFFKTSSEYLEYCNEFTTIIFIFTGKKSKMNFNK